ncbi:FecCD family ABC transporter permease [Cohnella cholangitidis]|uniref:Iron ABC transporter permease n=1 Tax=Cohnella cholangitidis TaxID=2598458 RepID=A0A7G5BWR9_9BACL|nr:iron ABC transporter permease [Cohnella cholangitidis]QMV41403.1 iron ABC transporter permease [Cohnella cholangitidis]
MRTFGLFLFLLLLVLSMLCSIAFGVADIPISAVIDSFIHYDASQSHIIIRDTRVPRALIAACVGASLAVAGVLMQVITRNPIASPSTFGVNSGAAFFVVLASGPILNLSGLQQLTWTALVGAAVSGVIVFILGSVGKDGMTPIKITLAGATIAAFFFSLTQGFMLADGKMFDQVLIWMVGSVAGREMDMLLNVLPYMVIGLILALFLSSHMNVLSMGDSVAKGLGMSTVRIKGMASLSIILLAGASVAVAGPIAFVGIIVPHIVRYLVGNDYRWVIPYSAVVGALLLVTADLGSRYIAMPTEIPVGVMTAILGVPFFVYIARKERRIG